MAHIKAPGSEVGPAGSTNSEEQKQEARNRGWSRWMRETAAVIVMRGGWHQISRGPQASAFIVRLLLGEPGGFGAF